MRLLWTSAVAGLLAISPLALAQSPFEGTWRPDPQKPGPTRKPDVFELAQGLYKCQSCEPPYAIKADGVDHAVAANTYYDVVSISVVDAHTVNKVAKKGGKTVLKSTMTVSADGKALTESQALYEMGPPVVEVTSQSTRVAAAQPGTHLVSGSWRLLEVDLTHHDEDTTFKVTADALSMSDRMGRSFTAKLDGTDAPYEGDPDFTSVSLKVIDSRTIEEYDKKDGTVVKISRWSIDPDGKTLHARFDNTHGKVQQQDGHKVEGSG